MQPFNFISNALYVAPTDRMGRGVFTNAPLKKGTLIEVAPVIVMSLADRAHIDQTLLHDYIFEWGDQAEACCMALGYLSLYNHSYRSNCEYEMDYELQVIRVHTVRSVLAGEELFINYNGDWNSERRVWFDDMA